MSSQGGLLSAHSKKSNLNNKALKPLIQGQSNLIKFIESNIFDNVNSKIWQIFVWSNFEEKKK